MGIEIQSVRLLLIARQMGVDFVRSLTVGRQDLLVTPDRLRHVFGDFGIALSDQESADLILSRDRFAEPVIEKIGARVVDSMDASNFEGATIVHDLNAELDPHLEQSYSMVFDGGTLEHIFNAPQAMRTYMSLPALGGHLIVALPANNEMGHGFYQFSPDLFYRILSPENGYEMRAMFLVTPGTDEEWLEVADPAILRSRVGHNDNTKKMYIFAIAKRVAIVPLFVRPPQQSDYASEWSNMPLKGTDPNRLAFFDRAVAGEAQRSRLSSIKRRILSIAPAPIKRFNTILRAGRRAIERPNPALFRIFSPTMKGAAALDEARRQEGRH